MAEATTKTDKAALHTIQHIEITADDPVAFRTFAERQFGWRFEAYPMPQGGTYHMYRTPDGNGGGVVAPQPGQAIAATPYINVADIEKTMKECEKNGAKILLPVTDVAGMGRFFWFQVAGGPPLACWQSTAPRA